MFGKNAIRQVPRPASALMPGRLTYPSRRHMKHFFLALSPLYEIPEHQDLHQGNKEFRITLKTCFDFMFCRECAKRDSAIPIEEKEIHSCSPLSTEMISMDQPRSLEFTSSLQATSVHFLWVCPCLACGWHNSNFQTLGYRSCPIHPSLAALCYSCYPHPNRRSKTQYPDLTKFGIRTSGNSSQHVAGQCDKCYARLHHKMANQSHQAKLPYRMHRLQQQRHLMLLSDGPRNLLAKCSPSRGRC